MYKQKSKYCCKKINVKIKNISRSTIVFLIILFSNPITIFSQHFADNKRTRPTFKIKYVADFGNKFILDGNIEEFEKYKEYQIEPDTAHGPEAANWTPKSSDCSFRTIMIIDDKYLYIAAELLRFRSFTPNLKNF